MRKLDRRRIAHEARLVIQHLVARRAEGADRKVDRLGNADRHQDLLRPVERRGEAAVEIAADRLAERGRAEVGRVVRAAVLKAGHRRPRNVPGRIEVRLAHAEGYDVLGLGDNVEELANSALRQLGDVLGDSFFHPQPQLAQDFIPASRFCTASVTNVDVSPP